MLAAGPLVDLAAQLPLATAPGVLDGLDGERAPDAGHDVEGPLGAPAWFSPGWREEDRGWSGALAFARAAAHQNPTPFELAGLVDLVGAFGTSS